MDGREVAARGWGDACSGLWATWPLGKAMDVHNREHVRRYARIPREGMERRVGDGDGIRYR
jgi:hypothetical protein